jgi:glyoxylase-like metal-dependent hydrolase (beta-lactamase superfamily II)
VDRVKVGNVEVLALQDAAAKMNPTWLFPQVADQLIAEWGHLRDERGLLPMSITTYLLRSAGKTILIDTGVGPRRRTALPRGKLDSALESAGISPDEIDTVINTHLHVDHVGWNTVDNEDGTRRIFFPRARWYVQRREIDYWMTPKHLTSDNAHLRECVEPVVAAGLYSTVDGEQAFDENLTLIPSPGHTPGHMSIGISSAGERAIIVGDASHHPVHLDHPDWSPQVDTDPAQSARTRDRLIEDAIADGRTWLAGHWPYPGMGRLVRLEGKRVFQAVPSSGEGTPG